MNIDPFTMTRNCTSRFERVLWKAHNGFVFLIICFLEKTLIKDYDTWKQVTSEAEVEVPEILLSCLILAEDHRFYNHSGIDLIGILRAFYTIVVNRKIEGASTIEQQYVRTVTGERAITISRKMKEWVSAYHFSRTYNKREIARKYLCTAYFGWNMNSIEQASVRLGFSLKTITPSEAAFIAALLKCPLPKKPTINRQMRIHSRQRHILKLLEKSEEKTKCLSITSQIG